nr:leporins efflux protein lepc [Quercus suber]
MLMQCPKIVDGVVTGVAMTFGIFQDAYAQETQLRGSKGTIGVIGTTMNGVMYLSMPFLSMILESGRWSRYRRAVAIIGTLLSCVSFLVSSWSLVVWQLLLLQGVLAALGNAMLYTPITLIIDEWFDQDNRATAWSVQLSSKNIVGTACPFLMYALLDRLGFRTALRVWSAVLLFTGLLGLHIIPDHPVANARRPLKVPWSFLRHQTFYIYVFANIVFSSGYGLPQTYLPSFARNELDFSPVLSSAMIAILNVPGIISCVGFGLLSDRTSLSSSTNTLLSTLGSALCAFLLWGLKSHEVPALLICFSLGYGFFASGFSSTWGGWIRDLEIEAAAHNEAINSGVLYGIMNGARGLGYVGGGLAGVELLKLGPVGRHSQHWAYGTMYGALILFTGISAALGGWGTVWKSCHGLKRKWQRLA